MWNKNPWAKKPATPSSTSRPSSSYSSSSSYTTKQTGVNSLLGSIKPRETFGASQHRAKEGYGEPQPIALGIVNTSRAADGSEGFSAERRRVGLSADDGGGAQAIGPLIKVLPDAALQHMGERMHREERTRIALKEQKYKQQRALAEEQAEEEARKALGEYNKMTEGLEEGNEERRRLMRRRAEHKREQEDAQATWEQSRAPKITIRHPKQPEHHDVYDGLARVTDRIAAKAKGGHDWYYEIFKEGDEQEKRQPRLDVMAGRLKATNASRRAAMHHRKTATWNDLWPSRPDYLFEYVSEYDEANRQRIREEMGRRRGVVVAEKLSADDGTHFEADLKTRQDAPLIDTLMDDVEGRERLARSADDGGGLHLEHLGRQWRGQVGPKEEKLSSDDGTRFVRDPAKKDGASEKEAKDTIEERRRYKMTEEEKARWRRQMLYLDSDDWWEGPVNQKPKRRDHGKRSMGLHTFESTPDDQERSHAAQVAHPYAGADRKVGGGVDPESDLLHEEKDARRNENEVRPSDVWIERLQPGVHHATREKIKVDFERRNTPIAQHFGASGPDYPTTDAQRMDANRFVSAQGSDAGPPPGLRGDITSLAPQQRRGIGTMGAWRHEATTGFQKLAAGGAAHSSDGRTSSSSSSALAQRERLDFADEITDADARPMQLQRYHVTWSHKAERIATEESVEVPRPPPAEATDDHHGHVNNERFSKLHPWSRHGYVWDPNTDEKRDYIRDFEEDDAFNTFKKTAPLSKQAERTTSTKAWALDAYSMDKSGKALSATQKQKHLSVVPPLAGREVEAGSRVLGPFPQAIETGAEKSEVEQQVDDAALWERVRLVDQYVPEKAHAPRGFESVVEVHMTKQLVPPQYPKARVLQGGASV